MDRYTLTYTCTCGDKVTEHFLDNTQSLTVMVKSTIALFTAGVEDFEIILHPVEGEPRDVTPEMLFTILSWIAFF